MKVDLTISFVRIMAETFDLSRFESITTVQYSIYQSFIDVGPLEVLIRPESQRGTNPPVLPIFSKMDESIAIQH